MIVPIRKRLPRTRSGRTTSFKVGECEGYIMTGYYPLDDFVEGDNEVKVVPQLGEIFLTVAKQGSTLAGLMDSLAIVTSVALQYGVPLKTIVGKLINVRFEPMGVTGDEIIPKVSSIIDYIFRRLGEDYLSQEDKDEIGFGGHGVVLE